MSLYPSPVLMPLSFLYGAVTRARAALYDAGVLTHTRRGVGNQRGNITAGGTGKTPAVGRSPAPRRAKGGAFVF